jgi:hypothetical protein
LQKEKIDKPFQFPHLLKLLFFVLKNSVPPNAHLFTPMFEKINHDTNRQGPGGNKQTQNRGGMLAPLPLLLFQAINPARNMVLEFPEFPPHFPDSGVVLDNQFPHFCDTVQNNFLRFITHTRSLPPWTAVS